MWGEIVEPVKTQPILVEEEKDGEMSESSLKVEILYQQYAINEPIDPRQRRQDTPVSIKIACNNIFVDISFALTIPSSILHSV